MRNKLRAFIDNQIFQNIIMGVIIFNAVIMGLQTSDKIVNATGNVLGILDLVCLGIFVVELVLKLIAYDFKFFKDGWNIFDLIIVLLSIFTTASFLSAFRVFRVFRAFRSLKAMKSLKGLKGFRIVSGVDKLRVIIEAIGKSIPGIMWSGILLLLIYYIFAIVGVTLFGSSFPDWFGDIGKSMYTLFQVMTLESWSMGISRPVMEVFNWAWLYFVPFVLIASFIVMNVVVGIVVNAISEVSGTDTKEDEKPEIATESDKEKLKAEIEALKKQIEKIEEML